MSHENERKSTGKAGRPPKQGDAAPATVLAVRLSVADQRHLAVVTERERARLRALGLPEGAVAKITNGAEIVRLLLEQAAAPAAREPGAPSSEEIQRQTASAASNGATAAAASAAVDDDALREATAKWCEADGKGANNRLAKLIDCRPEQLSRWKSGKGALSPERRDALAGIVGGAAKRRARRA